MKKAIFVLVFLVPAVIFGATQDVREVAKGFVTGAVTVSSTTPTILAAGTPNLPGRYRIKIINTDTTFAIAVGSHSAVTYANGFVVSNASATTSTIDLPLTAGTTIWGITQAAGAANVRVIEIK